MHTYLLRLTCATALALAASASAQTLSGTWAFGYNTNGTAQDSDVSASGFTVATARGNTTATTYFAPGATPVTLAVGESLDLSFNLSVTLNGTNQNDAFRFGLFNTGDSQTTGNNYTVVGNSAWDGYSIWVPSKAATGSVQLMDRTGTNNIVMAAGANTAINTKPYTTDTFVTGTYNNNTLSSTRTAIGTVSISGSIAGYAFTNIVDNTDAVFTFDALHFFGAGTPFGTNPAGDFAVSNLNLNVIPEPSSAAALVGLAALGLVGHRRRRR